MRHGTRVTPAPNSISAAHGLSVRRPAGTALDPRANALERAAAERGSGREHGDARLSQAAGS
jgi:hypothetical protein